MVFCYIIAVAMTIIGIAFFTGRATSYIKAYQTMPDEEKRNINIKPLCRNLSMMFFIAAVIFGIGGFSEFFRLTYLKWTMVGWLILGCADVLFISKSKRFVKEAASSRK